MRRGILWQYMLFALVLAVFAVFLLYPIWLTVRGGFFEDVTTRSGFTLEHIVDVFRYPPYREGLLNALLVAIGTTTLCFILALPLAVFSARYRFPLKKVFNAIILVPLILPPFVGAIGMHHILGRYGALNELLGISGFDWLGVHKFWAVVVVQALGLYPIVYLNATAALANLDPALDEAAENLGVPAWRRFVSITLPLIRPGLFAGGTIVFIWSFTELGTPLMLNYYAVTPVQIFNELTSLETSATPYALTVVMLVASIGLYAIGKGLFGGRAHAMYSKASRASEERDLTGAMRLVATGSFLLVCGLALVPHAGVVLAAFTAEGSWYRSVLPEHFTSSHMFDALSHPLAFGSIVNSLTYSSLAVVFDILLGLLIGYLVVRTKVRGRSILDSLAMLPLAVPGLVMAFGYVAMSINLSGSVGIFGPDGTLNLSVIGSNPNPIVFLVIAYAIRRLPYVVRATVAGLEQTSGELEEAARNLGAGVITAIRRIIVPLITANLIAGGLLAFSFAMLEVSDSLILAQQEEDFAITTAIYGFSYRLGDGPGIASAMGLWGMALLTVTLVGASVLMGKKLGAIFRV